MNTVLEQEWNSYFFHLNETERKSVLLLLKTLLKGRHTQQEPISIEQYNKEIDEALADVKKGNYISQEEMEKRASQW